MLKNYFKIALRNFLKHKGYSFINVTGLAIGIACCVLMLLFVQEELSYDRFHANAGRIYRVIGEESEEGNVTRVAKTYAPLAPILAAENPEIERIVRFFPHTVVVQRDDVKFQENNFFFCDSTVFEVFSFPMLQGDPKTALAAPNSVVLTQETAKRYFGDENSIGKILRIENQLDLTVTGVIENVPHNAHFSFDFLATMRSVDNEAILGPWVLTHGWHWPPMYTYLLLPNANAADAVEGRFAEMVRTKLPESRRGWTSFHLQPLTDIHLRSDLQNETAPTGSITYVYVFSLAAGFILLIACINFMNLATARSANRAKEVGLRKVVGAGQRQLVKQFLGESFVYALVAMFIAIAVVEFFLPKFNQLTGKQLDVAYLENWMVWGGMLGITLIVGLTAGSYPAFFLANFRPIHALQGKAIFGPIKQSPIHLRSVLVVAQFVISIALIIVTIVIHKQLGFIQNNRLGFDKEHIVIIPIRDEDLQNNYAALKNRVLSNPGIVSATAISNFPWEQGYYGFPMLAEGMAPDANASIATLIVDPDFVETFGVEILEGREFSKELVSDAGNAFILNQAAVKKLGWETALDKRFEVQKIISGNDMKGRVVGVMRDFHLRSLHHQIEPLVALIAPLSYYLDNLAVRISGRDVRAELAALEKNWSELVPHRPFEYFFLDDAFDRLYRKEQKLGEIFNYFAGLTIIVGCLGLFGLASFTAEQRTKEIGIRKVLGASTAGVVGLLSKDFVKLVLLANLIAWPAAWFAMNKWLQNFAYRVDISWWVFALAGGLALFIALFTVSTQAIKAALANPVDALRYE